MDMSLIVPRGIEGVLFATFALMAVVLIPLIASTNRRALVPAVVHALGGLLAATAGDLITLLVAWEIATFSAYFVVRTGSGTPQAITNASRRYLSTQIGAAVLFFCAIVIHATETGAVPIEPLVGAAQPWLIGAVLIKTAMMPLHRWMIDAYAPASPATGAFLSVYSTKIGVLTAARLAVFSIGSVPLLTAVGSTIAVVAVVFAFLQRTARRLLAYHIISQVGYMLAGVGMVAATDAARVAGLLHTVNHIIYKALLFLVVAAVVNRTGHDRLGGLGGLRRSMPIAFWCGVVGACAIAGVPLTSGYVSKELLKQATGGWATLLSIAGVGTGLSFIKFVYLLFMRPNPQMERCTTRGTAHVAVGARSASSRTMWSDTLLTVAMLTTAALSIGIGVAPGLAPGVPAHRFYSPYALRSALVPLAGSVLLWLVLRHRLIADALHERETSDPYKFVRAARRRALMMVRVVLNLDVQYGLAVTVAAVALGVLGLVLTL